MDTKKISIKTESAWVEIVPRSTHSATNDSQGRQIDTTYQTKAEEAVRNRYVDSELADRQPSTVIGAGATSAPKARLGREWVEVVGDDGAVNIDLTDRYPGNEVYLSKKYDLAQLPSFHGGNLGSETSHIYIKDGVLTASTASGEEEEEEDEILTATDDGAEMDGVLHADAVRVVSKTVKPTGDALDDAVTHREMANLYPPASAEEEQAAPWVLHIGDKVDIPAGYTATCPQDPVCKYLMESKFSPAGAEHFTKSLLNLSSETGKVRYVVGGVGYSTRSEVDLKLAEMTYKDGTATKTVTVEYDVNKQAGHRVGDQWVLLEYGSTDTPSLTATKVSLTVNGVTTTVALSTSDLTKTGEWNYSDTAVNPVTNTVFHNDFHYILTHTNACAISNGKIEAISKGTGFVHLVGTDGTVKAAVYTVVEEKPVLDIVVFDGQSNNAYMPHVQPALGYTGGETPARGVGYIFGYEGFTLDYDWAFNARGGNGTKPSGSRVVQDINTYYHHWAHSPLFNNPNATGVTFSLANLAYPAVGEDGRESYLDSTYVDTWPAVLRPNHVREAKMCDMHGAMAINVLTNTSAVTALGSDTITVIPRESSTVQAEVKDPYPNEPITNDPGSDKFDDESLAARMVCNVGSHEGAFAKRWNELTGHKVYVINLSSQGRSLDQLAGVGTTNAAYMVKRRLLLRRALDAIPADTYDINFLGTVWLQGETADTTDYATKFLTMRSELFKEISTHPTIGKYVSSEDDQSYISLFWYIGSKGINNLEAQMKMCDSKTYPTVHCLTGAAHNFLLEGESMTSAGHYRISNGHTNVEGRKLLGRVWAENLYAYRRGLI